MAPYRRAELNCPCCHVELEPTGLCAKCEGGWVSESSLKKRLEAVTVDNTQLPNFDGFAKTGKQKYECPACNAALDVVLVSEAGIEVERCPAAHGIWFDANELQAVLLKAAEGRSVDSTHDNTLKPTLLGALLVFLSPSQPDLWW